MEKEELKRLAASIKTYGQREPGKVKELNNGDSDHKYELIDGQRRWHALDMAGLSKMKVIVVEVNDTEEQFMMSVMANFGRADHGPLEIANAIMRFRMSNKNVAEICEIFVKSDAWVYQHIKIAEKLHSDVQNMMAQEIPEEDRLIFSIALALADIPMEHQKKTC